MFSSMKIFIRWSFIEEFLNLISFQCSNEEECKKTEAVRKDFPIYTQGTFGNSLKCLLLPMVLGHYLIYFDCRTTQGQYCTYCVI